MTQPEAESELTLEEIELRRDLWKAPFAADRDLMPAHADWLALHRLGFGSPVPAEDPELVRATFPEGWAKHLVMTPSRRHVGPAVQVVDERGIKRISIQRAAGLLSASIERSPGSALAWEVMDDESLGLLPAQWTVMTPEEQTQFAATVYRATQGYSQVNGAIAPTVRRYGEIMLEIESLPTVERDGLRPVLIACADWFWRQRMQQPLERLGAVVVAYPDHLPASAWHRHGHTLGQPNVDDGMWVVPVTMHSTGEATELTWPIPNRTERISAEVELKYWPLRGSSQRHLEEVVWQPLAERIWESLSTLRPTSTEQDCSN